MPITDVGEQESLKANLKAVLFAICWVLRHPLVKRIVTDLHAEIVRTPMLEQAIQPFRRARRQRIDVLSDRAIARREIAPSVDREAERT